MAEPAVPRTRPTRIISLNTERVITLASPGRYCTAPGCTVRLSRHNLQQTCVTHGGWRLREETSREAG